MGLDDFIDAHEEELVAFRRELHAHPERSGEERETTARVAERLRISGLSRVLEQRNRPLVRHLLRSAGPIVALRADLDALAMDDEKEVPYRSQVPGVAHACGHDVHTTVVLGAGLALAKALAATPAPGGTVRLIFQPAEEALPGGALDVIADGGLDGTSWIFGLHCDPKLDVGKIGRAPARSPQPPIYSRSSSTAPVGTPRGHSSRLTSCRSQVGSPPSSQRKALRQRCPGPRVHADRDRRRLPGPSRHVERSHETLVAAAADRSRRARRRGRRFQPRARGHRAADDQHRQRSVSRR